MPLGNSQGGTRTQIFTDLYDELASHRHAEHARAMAESLLRAEREGVQFVGVVADFDRAVYFEETDGALVARAFDKHGVSEELDEIARGVEDPGAWVATSPPTFGWVHPRYR